MSDTQWDAGSVRQVEYVAAIVIDMAVDHIIWAVLLENPPEVERICPGPLWVQTRDNLAAERPDLIVISAWAGGMDQEIQPETLAVNVTQDMHQPRLCTARIHTADDL